MIYNSSYLTVSLSLLLLCGCSGNADNFQLVATEGRTYLLNKRTGELKIVVGQRLIELNGNESANGAHSITKRWPTQKIPQLSDLEVNVSTKYRDGQLLFSATAAPFAGMVSNELDRGNKKYWEESTSKLILKFQDADGFNVGTPIQLQLSSGSKQVNEKGEPEALVWSGSQQIEGQSYTAITSIAIGWAGFK